MTQRLVTRTTTLMRVRSNTSPLQRTLRQREGVSQDPAPDTDTDTKVIAGPITSPPAPRPSRPPVPMREPSTRISTPVDRLNLMYVKRVTKIFTEKAVLAMVAEVTSLLGKQTFRGVHGRFLSGDQRKQILRSIMNITEKFPPTLNDSG